MPRPVTRLIVTAGGIASLLMAQATMAWNNRDAANPQPSAEARLEPPAAAPAAPIRVDVRKSAIETPVKDLIASGAVQKAAANGPPPVSPAVEVPPPVSPPGSPPDAAPASGEADRPAPGVAGLARVDMRKSVIETPVKRLIAREAVQKAVGHDRHSEPVSPAADASRSVSPPAPPSAGHPAGGAPGPVNPAVAPGLVQWHETLDQARAAAEASGRPMLLFQMIGRLDQRFT
jgi:hypothetical protein